ncbi:E3 ubiquitin-protein ligase SINAT2-like [Cornus florida]|uniref:E3 ubiquitin-protein ligase SINAT2-like n=1 Tax=Cornus florida TaxID=4283 RepID=UPI0028991BE1|nr:E3 ubiquitin-protein ligase SINAT2-like [Cornus florida]
MEKLDSKRMAEAMATSASSALQVTVAGLPWPHRHRSLVLASNFRVSPMLLGFAATVTVIAATPIVAVIADASSSFSSSPRLFNYGRPSLPPLSTPTTAATTTIHLISLLSPLCNFAADFACLKALWMISFDQHIIEPCTATADYGKEHSDAEIRSSTDTNSTTVGGKYGMMANTVLHNLLECPVCMNLMYPPIYQCQNGHALCSNCKANIHKICPVCRQVFGSIRCLALEKVAETLGLPCMWWNLGCQDIFPVHSKLGHEQNCRFRPYRCPYNDGKCSATGDIQFLLAHLKDDHNVNVDDVDDGYTFNLEYTKLNPEKVEKTRWKLAVFNCFSHHFCLHFEAFRLEKAFVYLAFLRFMGDDDEAKKFSYSLEVGRNGRKLTWQGFPRSIRDSCKTVRESLDGLVIQKNMSFFFFDGDSQKLRVKLAGRIWKEQLKCNRDVL